MTLETLDVFKESEPFLDRPPGETLDRIPESFSRKRLEDELRKSEGRLLRQNAVLQGVNQVFEKALVCESEEEMALVCLSVARALTSSQLGFIGELNEHGRLGAIALSVPECNTCRTDESHAVPMIRDMELRGIWRQALQDGESLIVNEPSSHPSRVGAPEGHAPIECFLGIPWRKEDNVIGMIGLANKEGGYDRADQEAVEALSNAFVETLERKRAEESLRRSERRYRQLLAAVTSYTYSVELDGGLTVSAKHSPGCLSATGYSPDEFEHDPNLWIFMVHPDDRKMVRQHAVKVMAGEDVSPIEHRIFHKDETVRWVRDTLVRHCNDRGQLVRYDGLVEDITTRKQAEEALRKKDEQLRQSQKLEAVGGLAGGIAHEFNNLLQAIGGYTKYAMEGLFPDEQRFQDLEQVVKAVDRATTLTRQLLSFGRRQVLERRNVDPNEVFADLIEMVRPVIGEHIHLELETADKLGAVYADPGELQQVLLNLCLNARDAMPSGGRLVLKTESAVLDRDACKRHPGTRPGRHVVLSVTDTGCGIPPELKKRIFEPFFTTKRVGEGTGLGLATVYGIVEQHGGTIRVHSEVGQGATFMIHLPAVNGTAEAEGISQSESTQGGTETILLAEDEPMVRNIAVRILESAGYTVLVASDGREALRLFEENREAISAVLLDAVMPGLSGYKVYRRIKERCPETEVIFCSGYDFETSHSDFISSEHLRLVKKPFDPHALLRTLREALDREEPCQAVQEDG